MLENQAWKWDLVIYNKRTCINKSNRRSIAIT